MNKSCARCEKTVYPTEELKCLDKVIKLLTLFAHLIRARKIWKIHQGQQVFQSGILMNWVALIYAFWHHLIKAEYLD